jgi:hypothetical protein
LGGAILNCKVYVQNAYSSTNCAVLGCTALCLMHQIEDCMIYKRPKGGQNLC